MLHRLCHHWSILRVPVRLMVSIFLSRVYAVRELFVIELRCEKSRILSIQQTPTVTEMCRGKIVRTLGQINYNCIKKDTISHTTRFSHTLVLLLHWRIESPQLQEKGAGQGLMDPTVRIKDSAPMDAWVCVRAPKGKNASAMMEICWKR